MADLLKAYLFSGFEEYYRRVVKENLDEVANVVTTPVPVYVNRETGEESMTTRRVLKAVGLTEPSSEEAWTRAVDSCYFKYPLNVLSDADFERYSAAFPALNNQTPRSRSRVVVIHTSKHGAFDVFDAKTGIHVDTLVAIHELNLPVNAPFKSQEDKLIATVELEDQSPIGPEPPLTEQFWEKMMDTCARVANRIIDRLSEDGASPMVIVIHCSAGQSRSTLFIWLLKMVLGRISVEGRFEDPRVLDELKRIVGFDFQMDISGKFAESNALRALQVLVEQRDIIAVNPKWIPVMLYLANGLSTSRSSAKRVSEAEPVSQSSPSKRARRGGHVEETRRRREGETSSSSSSSMEEEERENIRPLLEQWCDDRRTGTRSDTITVSDSEEEEDEEDEDARNARILGVTLEVYLQMKEDGWGA